MTEPQQGQKGVTPDPKEAVGDHVDPKAKGEMEPLLKICGTLRRDAVIVMARKVRARNQSHRNYRYR